MWMSLILVAIIGFGCYALLTKDRSGSGDTNIVAQTNESNVSNVEISSNGLNPQTLRIKTGTTVNWVNIDEVAHSVVSGPYPKNDSLEDLDTEEPLEKAESFSFVFEKSGTFEYHDNSGNKIFNGTIIVE